ncbi:MAG: outer membrane protein assembly factor BamB [Gammaproteobacteria bacterium]|nr:outer membrane protein assembly factor BamB [Gammaproteobacteria bacterium]
MPSTRPLIRLLFVGLLSVLAGCSTLKGWFSMDSDDAANQPAPLEDIAQEVDIKKVWSTSVGSGQGKGYNYLAPVIEGQVMYVASNDGLVVALDKNTGKTIWKEDLDRPISGGVGVGSGTLVVGTSDGEVLLLSASDGSVQWTASVHGEVLSAPQTNGQIVLVQSYDGRLQGLSASDGSELWVYGSNVPILTLRGTCTPIIEGRLAIAAFANGKVMALDVKTGAIRWEARAVIAQGRSEIDRIVDIDGHMLLVGNILYAVGYQGRLVALDVSTGRKMWQQDASSYVGLDQGFGNIYVADANGSVVAFHRSGQGVRWEQPALEYRRLSSPKTVKGYVTVADLDGYVHFLSQVDGHFVGRIKVDGDGVRGRMLAEEDILYVYGNGGKLVALRVSGREQ